MTTGFCLHTHTATRVPHMYGTSRFVLYAHDLFVIDAFLALSTYARVIGVKHLRQSTLSKSHIIRGTQVCRRALFSYTDLYVSHTRGA